MRPTYLSHIERAHRLAEITYGLIGVAESIRRLVLAAQPNAVIFPDLDERVHLATLENLRFMREEIDRAVMALVSRRTVPGICGSVEAVQERELKE